MGNDYTDRSNRRDRDPRRSRTPAKRNNPRDPRTWKNDRDNNRVSQIDRDYKNRATFKPSARRYNPRVPYEALDRTPLNQPANKQTNKYDEASAEIKTARKRNTIKFPILAESKNWPHGKLTSFIVNLIATKREAAFFDMLQEHVEKERKGPSSLYNTIEVKPRNVDETLDLNAMLMNK